MYANLLEQKANRKMSNEDMAKIIGVSRNSYEAKIKSGRFTPQECFKYIKYFNKTFAFLFATDND